MKCEAHLIVCSAMYGVSPFQEMSLSLVCRVGFSKTNFSFFAEKHAVWDTFPLDTGKLKLFPKCHRVTSEFIFVFFFFVPHVGLDILLKTIFLPLHFQNTEVRQWDKEIKTK